MLKVLRAAGIGSRRFLAGAVRDGRVKVNGGFITDYNHPVDLKNDHVTFDNQPVKLATVSPVYLILHKPAGVLSTTSDDRGRSTIMDFVPFEYRKSNLFPVGRLDRESTGLVLITNDGDLAYRLSHPSFEQPKEYHVVVDDRLSGCDIKRLQQGLLLEDGQTCPARVKPLLGEKSQFAYSITIHEGRKHIVRRMLAHLGYRVTSLKRVRLSSLCLGNLDCGHIRLLTDVEVKRLLKEG